MVIQARLGNLERDKADRYTEAIRTFHLSGKMFKRIIKDTEV